MQCPVDGETLGMADRAGVEIDYCPKCRGVWLDRGELDKVVERSSAPAPRDAPRPRDDHRDDSHARDRLDKDRHDGRHPGKRRREGFLSDLFDF